MLTLMPMPCQWTMVLLQLTNASLLLKAVPFHETHSVTDEPQLLPHPPSFLPSTLIQSRALLPEAIRQTKKIQGKAQQGKPLRSRTGCARAQLVVWFPFVSLWTRESHCILSHQVQSFEMHLLPHKEKCEGENRQFRKKCCVSKGKGKRDTFQIRNAFIINLGGFFFP